MTIEPEVNKFKYQKDFIDYVNTLEKFSADTTSLYRSLKNPKIERIESYQSSYLGRVTSNLADTIFEECAHLFGHELVAHLLADFFKNEPPTAANLIDAPANLTVYLREGTTSRESLLFADLAEICLKRWAILIGPDPKLSPPSTSSNFSELFLLPSTDYVKPCAKHDLYSCWNQAQSKTDCISEEIFMEFSGVLLAKTSPTNFLVIAVPPELSPLVESMTQGSNLELAIDTLTQSTRELSQESLAATLQHLISTLVGSNILTTCRE